MENNQIAVFGGGCFWCTEAVYQKLKGVDKVVSGYSGGDMDNPSYEKVSGGSSGHAEVIQITYDPQVVSYRQLLEVFFAVHDPTTLNQQGADLGTQYRSVIFYFNEEQKNEAEGIIQELTKDGAYQNPIVTEIKPLIHFYPAEDYHQNYYNQNQNQPYCQVVINPKLDKFKKTFASLLKE